MVGTRADEVPACFLLLSVEHIHPAQGLGCADPDKVHPRDLDLLVPQYTLEITPRDIPFRLA
jgi:hypothetical protein